jgi:hypothetical protein
MEDEQQFLEPVENAEHNHCYTIVADIQQQPQLTEAG